MKKRNLVSGIRSLVIVAGLSGAMVASAQSDPVYGWTNFVGQPGDLGAADGTGGAARFWHPSGVALDGEGNLYVADRDNHTIRKVTPVGEVTTLAGRAGILGHDDGTGNAALFWNPSGVAVDRAGSVFIADHRNNTIRKMTPAGEVTTLAGHAGDWGSTDGTGGSARFWGPFDLAVDDVGSVYVADTWNFTIRKVTAAGAVTTFAGHAGLTGSADGTGGAARFYTPSGMGVDRAGNVYAADYWNSTIRKVTAAGVVTTFAGQAGSLGSTDGTGSAARFWNPVGVAVDSAGRVYVADTYNHTIRRVTPEGAVTTLGGVASVSGGSDGIGRSANFHYPEGIAVDSEGTLYVADTENHRIAKGVPLFPPLITEQPAARTNNVGTTATFSVTATGTDPLSYQWSLNGTSLAGATGSSLTLTNVQSADAGNYSVQVTNVAGSTVSSNALLVVNLSPTVLISSPTNGSVMLAPASFTLIADATDALDVAQVEFRSGTNSLGTVTNAPWYVVQTNLLAGEYDYAAVAVDALGLASTSTVCTVTVLSQPPATALALVTNSVMVRQTGLFYQTVRVSNPTAAPFAALRLWVELDADSIARGVQIWNATGRSNRVPYLSYSLSLGSGQSVDLQIEYYVPDRRTLPSPAFRTEIVAPEPPLEPEGIVLSSVRQLPLTNGQFLVEFSTGPSQLYYVQYSSDLTGWKTALPAVMGTGSRVQWIDNGPPKTESLPSSEPNRFYRVLQLPFNKSAAQAPTPDRSGP